MLLEVVQYLMPVGSIRLPACLPVYQSVWERYGFEPKTFL